MQLRNQENQQHPQIPINYDPIDKIQSGISPQRQYYVSPRHSVYSQGRTPPQPTRFDCLPGNRHQMQQQFGQLQAPNDHEGFMHTPRRSQDKLYQAGQNTGNTSNVNSLQQKNNSMSGYNNQAPTTISGFSPMLKLNVSQEQQQQQSIDQQRPRAPTCPMYDSLNGNNNNGNQERTNKKKKSKSTKRYSGGGVNMGPNFRMVEQASNSMQQLQRGSDLLLKTPFLPSPSPGALMNDGMRTPQRFQNWYCQGYQSQMYRNNNQCGPRNQPSHT